MSCTQRARRLRAQFVHSPSDPLGPGWFFIQPVFFGTSWLTATNPIPREIALTVHRLCDSDYFDALQQVVPGFQGVLERPPLFMAETSLVSGFTDADVWRMLIGWLQSRKMLVDAQTLYVLLVPPGIAASGDASGRYVWDWNGTPLRYCWITDVITASDQRTHQDAFTTHLSRELIELCADPDGKGVCPAREAADRNDWATRDDPGLCLDTFTRRHGILTQSYWSHRALV